MKQNAEENTEELELSRLSNILGHERTFHRRKS